MTRNHRRVGRALVLGGGLLLAVLWTRPAMAQPGPRQDLQGSYEQATAQFNNLELETAQQTLEAAISRAQQGGLSNDPALAPLLTMRAGIIYSLTGDRERTVAAFEEAVRADYYAAIPIELRSDELQAMLDEARSRVGSPPSAEPIAHQPPDPAPGRDLQFVAKMNVPMLEGFQAALYWRYAGEQEFRSAAMDTFGNLASAIIPASQHQNRNIEYAIYAFDANQQPVANTGSTDAPLTVQFGQAAGGGAGDGDGTDGDGPTDDDGQPTGENPLPRVFINLGVGTGLGIARGEAEQSYLQYTLANDYAYSTGDAACALMRWYHADGQVPQNAGGFVSTIQDIEAAGVTVPEAIANAPYNADQCARRHPVQTGTASAPFHIEPELGVRIGDNFVLSAFGRLQVVTGSKVYRGDDPAGSADPSPAFANTVRNPDPEGERSRPDFTWAVGAKAKYFLLPEDNKFRLFLGGMAGGGFARLMVDMGFTNDRNGNSVPDGQEQAAVFGSDGSCVNVWPYDGCSGMESESMLAQTVASNAEGNRIDTVRLGPVFVGGLLGFNWQLHKNFALFGEVQISGWFWDTSSVLFDVNVGPAITF